MKHGISRRQDLPSLRYTLVADWSYCHKPPYIHNTRSTAYKSA